MSIPVLPGTHTWVRGGPVLAKAGRAALYVSDDADIWVWDEDTDTRVTDLLDASGSPVTSPAVSGGWVDGVGVPVAVQVCSFSVGQFGKRYELIPVQTLRDASAALAPTDTQVATLLGNPASDTAVADAAAIDARLGGDATDLVPDVAGKVEKPGTGKNSLTGWFHADGFGVATGNTAAANDTALTTAVTAMTSGDTLYIPPAASPYLFTTLAPAKAVHLRGAAGHVSNQVAYGDASWTNGTADVTGTVLRCTATSGVAIDIDDVAANNGTSLSDLTLIGPGSGTTIGLRLGPAAGIGYPVRTRLHNVNIANFATGLYAACENSVWSAVFITSCAVGLQAVHPFNGNTIVGLNVERCATIAVWLDACDTNVFVGGVIQGNYGDGITLTGSSYANTFTGLYVENIGTGTYDDIKITNSRENEFHRIHLGSTTGTPRITLGSGAINNLIRATRGFSGSTIPHALVLTSSSANRLLGNFAGTITDGAASGNVVERNGDDAAVFAPTGFVGSQLSNSITVTCQLAVMTGNGQTWSLPDPATVPKGRVYRVKNGSAATGNAINSAGTSKTLDGAASKAFVGWQAYSFISDGTQWLTV